MSVARSIHLSTRLIGAFVLGVAAMLFAGASFAAEGSVRPSAENNLPLWAGKTYEIEDPIKWWVLKFKASPDGKKYSAEIKIFNEGVSMECSGSIDPLGELFSPNCRVPDGWNHRNL